MKQFAAWVSGRIYRAGLVAAALGLMPVLALIGSGLLVLTTLRGGSPAGWGAAAVGTAVLLAASVVSGGDPAVAFFAALVFWAPAIGLSELLRRTGSLSTCVQSAVIGGLLLTASWIFAMGSGDGAWTRALRDELRPLLQGASDETLGLVMALMPSALAGSLMLAAVLALFFGMWMQASLISPGAFGKAFRECRLGRVISGITVVVVIAAFLTGQTAFVNLTVVAGFAFVLQGLAVAHALVHAKGWSQRPLVAMYAVLFLVFSVAAPLLAIVGVLDSWVDFRGRGAQSS